VGLNSTREHDQHHSEKPLVLGGVLRIFLALIAAISTTQASPKIVVEEPVFNFGVITNGSYVEHDFIIRNVGDSELIVNQVKSSCSSCLQARISQTTIPPGSFATLRSHLDLRLMSGSVSRAIMIGCNDAQHPQGLLELVGVVIPMFQVEPLEISLDVSQGQQSGTAAIVSLSPLRQPLSQIIADSTNVELELSQKSPVEYVLTAQARHLTDHNNISVKVKISSVDSNDPPCFISVWVHNPPEIEVLPQILLFQPRIEQQTRILWVKQHGAVPLALMDVVAPSEKYHCEIDPDPVSNNYRIYVNTWQQDQSAGQTNVLTLKMLDAGNLEKFISVPIYTQPL